MSTKDVEGELHSFIHSLETSLLTVRDRLQVVVDGEIERSHCLAGERECYGGKPGKRKLTLKDAKAIAKHCISYINHCVNESYDRSM